MRFLAAAIFALALLAPTGEARAQHFGDIWPWCLQMSGGFGGGATNCGFATWAQCMASKTGNADMCMPNALFDPSRHAPRAAKRQRKG